MSAQSNDRLESTIIQATNELRKVANHRVTWMGIFRICASWLQVLSGAAITALSSGVKLHGIDTSTTTLIIGAVSTVTALVLAYLKAKKGLNAPYASQSRARELRNLLREIENFRIDSAIPNVHIQDNKIERFQSSLDGILQPHPRIKDFKPALGQTPTQVKKGVQGETGEGRV